MVSVGDTVLKQRCESRPRRRESGWVAAMTALLLVPLMVMAALAVDVGAWYLQASKAQTAADAATLAGVIYMPDREAARQAALDEAARNGFVDGVDGVSIVIEFPGEGSLAVLIHTPADQHFSQVVKGSDDVTIARGSESAYQLPIPMGSPTNMLGFGPNTGALSNSGVAVPANYWIIEGAECLPTHYGDIKAAKYDRKYGNEGFCGNHGAPRSIWKGNSTGRDGGYFYVIEIPAGFNQTSDLYIYDPGDRCGGTSRGKPADVGPDLSWRVWNDNDTPLIRTDDYVDAGISGGTDFVDYDDCARTVATDGGWTKTRFRFPENTSKDAKRYYLQSNASGKAGNWNYHAYWIRPTGSQEACFTFAGGGCPTISAEEWLPAGAWSSVKDTPMNLYLAEVGPEYENKTLNVKLWDPGEGMDNIQVVDPNGKSLEFEWSSDDPSQGKDNPNDWCSGKPCLFLDPGRTSYAPKVNNAGWGRSYRFNGRLITLQVPLDDQVDYDSYNNYWFILQFNPDDGKVAKEWASFSLDVTGDPVRLTE